MENETVTGTKLHRVLERSARETRVLLGRRHFNEREALAVRHEKESLRAYSQWKTAYDEAYPNGEKPRDD